MEAAKHSNANTDTPHPPVRVLIIDDNEDILLAARLLLKQHGATVYTSCDPADIPGLLDRNQFDVILLDMNFTEDVSGGHEGFYWLERIHGMDPDAVVVFITAYGDVETATRAIEMGATDFVLKPWQNQKLWATISAAADLRRSRSEANSLRERQKQLSADLDQPFHDFIGVSPVMKQVFRTIKKVSVADANVLILGENGTGKELVARAIHRGSNRADEVFITVDIGALQDSLFESELFGHVQGAFTGATEDRAGRFETADGGTLFLDEIGNLPLALQSKLLSVLEKREVTRLGSNRARHVNIRLLAATNEPLQKLVEDGRFRLDLLYRLNTVEIHLPPLRERSEDIPLLANHFAAKYAKKYHHQRISLDESAMQVLTEYSWPGNVRELQHAIERAVIMADGAVLTDRDFPGSLLVKSAPAGTGSGGALEAMERATIVDILRKYDRNVSRAANELGLTRASLYRRMKKYGL